MQADKSGSGSALIYLRNDSNTPLTVVLSAGQVPIGETVPSYAQIYFGAENETGPGEPEYRLVIPAETTTKIKALVTRAWGTAQSINELLNGSARIGQLVVLPSSINVGLLEPLPDKPELNVTDGKPARIVLKNDDPIPHQLSYRLVVNGRQVAGNQFQVGPLRSSVLEFVPTMTTQWNVWPSVLERLREIFKPQVDQGSVLYLYQVQSAGVEYSSPAKIIPLNTTFNYFSTEWRETLNYVLIIFILVLGGVASLTFGHSLPNLLERLNIIEQLNELARVTSNLSSNIESRLGVLIRLERSRLSQLLKSRTTISPDFETTLAQCKTRVAKLESRVELVQQLDVVIGRLYQSARDGAPSSRVDDIDQSLQQTCETLKKDDPADQDLQDARKAIATGLANLDAINRPNSDFGKALFQKVQDMTSSLPATGTNATFDRIVKAVPSPGAILKGVPTASAEVVPASYTTVDAAIRKMQILRDYAVFAEGTTNPDTQARLKSSEPQLVQYLGVESWEALQVARLLLREMKDDLYPERLREALNASPIGASIDMEPKTAYEEEPLQFAVCFTNQFIDTSSAREEWVCNWNFGDGLQAEGWVVSHYFLLSESSVFRHRKEQIFKITASFQDAAGKQVTQTGKTDPILVSKEIKVQRSRLRDWLGERTVAEVARLSVALLVAVCALVAGVKDQLTKLDLLPGLIAIFAAGYGVDVLKNLINSNKNS
ncbi:MAG: hypothetical protein ABSG16_21585 [Candidatus Acidiferrum sp.]